MFDKIFQKSISLAFGFDKELYRKNKDREELYQEICMEYYNAAFYESNLYLDFFTGGRFKLDKMEFAVFFHDLMQDGAVVERIYQVISMNNSLYGIVDNFSTETTLIKIPECISNEIKKRLSRMTFLQEKVELMNKLAS